MSENDNTKNLHGLLGFDPVKSSTLSKTLFDEVVGEIQKERANEAKVKAKELLLKAMDIQKQMHKAKKEFENQYNKSSKELGKVMNMIQGLLSGQSPEEEKEEKTEKTE